MTILYALLLAAMPAAGAQPAASVNPPKLRCRTETQIGTLAGRTKICHTEAEWKQIYRNGRDSTAGMQQPSASAPPAAN